MILLTKKRRTSTHKYLCYPDHLPDIRRLFPAAGILRPQRCSAWIHGATVRPYGTEGEEHEREESRRI